MGPFWKRICIESLPFSVCSRLKMTLTAKGCLTCQVYQDYLDPSQVMIYEEWWSQEHEQQAAHTWK